MNRRAEAVFAGAVRQFWLTRGRQAEDQAERGSEYGARGGKQMDGFVDAIARALVAAGVDDGHIYLARGRQLPGFFRATKDWDMVVARNGHLLAAIELKSQIGPSFGNNFNNRTEEALGNALDLWTAYREGAFGTSPAPWLGYLFLLEDAAGSRTVIRVNEPHFKVFPEFRAASYARRYELLCRKLVLERQYNSACFLTARREDAAIPVNYAEPDAAALGAEQFLTQLIHHVAAR